MLRLVTAIILGLVSWGIGSIWVTSNRAYTLLTPREWERSGVEIVADHGELRAYLHPDLWGLNFTTTEEAQTLVRCGRFSVCYNSALNTRQLIVTLPIWLLFGAGAIYPLLVYPLVPFRRLRQFLRRRRGLCIACGYTLAHLPEPRCPECGTAFDRPWANGHD